MFLAWCICEGDVEEVSGESRFTSVETLQISFANSWTERYRTVDLCSLYDVYVQVDPIEDIDN